MPQPGLDELERAAKGYGARLVALRQGYALERQYDGLGMVSVCALSARALLELASVQWGALET